MYGRGTDRDSVATRELHEMLGSISEDEVRAAQGLAAKMFETYLSDADAARAGHLWSWFVQRWNGLRDVVKNGKPAPAGAPRATGYAVVRGGKDWSAGMDRVKKR